MFVSRFNFPEKNGVKARERAIEKRILIFVGKKFTAKRGKRKRKIRVLKKRNRKIIKSWGGMAINVEFISLYLVLKG